MPIRHQGQPPHRGEPSTEITDRTACWLAWTARSRISSHPSLSRLAAVQGVGGLRAVVYPGSQAQFVEQGRGWVGGRSRQGGGRGSRRCRADGHPASGPRVLVSRHERGSTSRRVLDGSPQGVASQRCPPRGLNPGLAWRSGRIAPCVLVHEGVWDRASTIATDTPLGYHGLPCRTVAETPTFSRQADKLFNEGRETRTDRLPGRAPLGGVPRFPARAGSEKMRFGASGRGKRGGARVIYFFRGRRNADLRASRLLRSPARPT